jgi:hypothetical protein
MATSPWSLGHLQLGQIKDSGLFQMEEQFPSRAHGRRILAQQSNARISLRG